MPVPFCVNPTGIPLAASGEQLLSPDAFAGLVNDAFGTWGGVPGVGISFAYQGFCDGSPRVRYDGLNTVGFAMLDGNAGGSTRPTFTDVAVLREGEFSQMVEADITIDSRFAAYFDPDHYREVVLPHILVHEAGHFLGLDHSSDHCSVMVASGLNPTPTRLCQDDIDAIRTLYPR